MACVLDMPWGPRAPPVTAHCPHHPTPGGRALSGQVGGDPRTEPRGPPGTASLRPAPKLPALGLTAAFTGPSRWAVRSGCPLAPSRGPAGRAWRPRHRGAGGRRPCPCVPGLSVAALGAGAPTPSPGDKRPVQQESLGRQRSPPSHASGGRWQPCGPPGGPPCQDTARTVLESSGRWGKAAEGARQAPAHLALKKPGEFSCFKGSNDPLSAMPGFLSGTRVPTAAPHVPLPSPGAFPPKVRAPPSAREGGQGRRRAV